MGLSLATDVMKGKTKLTGDLCHEVVRIFYEALGEQSSDLSHAIKKVVKSEGGAAKYLNRLQPKSPK
jgi:hypothetical protein